MSVWWYLKEWGYFDTNRYTVCLVIFLLALPFFKYIPTPKISANKWLLLIIALGFFLRLGWLCYSTYTPLTRYPGPGKPFLENDIINILAHDLTQGKWFLNADGIPAARRPIGYPLFLGALYKLFGSSPYVAYTANLFLHLCTTLLLYLLGKKIFNEKTGLWAAFLFAIYPVSIYSVKLTADEHLFLPLWFWGIYLLIKEVKGDEVRWPIIWYGTLFGYAAMTRTHAIFMPFIVALAYLCMKKNWKKILLGFIGTLIIMQLVNLPWIIRNYKIWGKPVLYTASNRALYDSLRSGATPGGTLEEGAEPQQQEYPPDLAEAMKGGNQAVINQVAGKEIKGWILSDPAEFLKFGIKRYIVFMAWAKGGVWATWYQFSEGSYDPTKPYPQKVKNTLEYMQIGFYYILFYVFIFTIFYMFIVYPSLVYFKKKILDSRQAIPVFILFSCFVFWSFLHFAIYPYWKYRYPLEALMMIFAAYYMDYFIRVFRLPKAAK